MVSVYLIDGLKVAVISGLCSLVLWMIVYTVLAPWWRNIIGRTLIAKSLLVAGLLIPAGLTLYFPDLNRTVITWVDLILIGLITPIMIWRTVVWLKLYKLRKLGHGRNATDLEEDDKNV